MLFFQTTTLGVTRVVEREVFTSPLRSTSPEGRSLRATPSASIGIVAPLLSIVRFEILRSESLR